MPAVTSVGHLNQVSTCEKDETAISHQTSPLILGIDPGLSVTGYGLVRPMHNSNNTAMAVYVEAGVIRTSDQNPLEARLLEIHEGVSDVLKEYSPDVVAIEALYSHYAHPKTAILMGHARGVICCAASSHSIPVYNYGATHIKRALTGNGRAPKDQMQRAIAFFLDLPATPEPPDTADALAAALCHLESRSDEEHLSRL